MAITDFLFNPTTIIELIALAAALLFLPRKQTLYPGVFVYYLLLVVIIEFLGFYFRTVLKTPNAYLYNGLNIVQATFFCYLLSMYQLGSKKGNLIKYIWYALLLVFVLESAFRISSLPVQEHYNRYFRILFGAAVVVLSLRFYMNLLKEDSLTNPLKEGRFWISTGLFFYYLCSTPMFSLDVQVAKIKLSGNISFYTLVMACINVILYGCWVIAFICLKKDQSSKQSSSYLPSLRW